MVVQFPLMFVFVRRYFEDGEPHREVFVRLALTRLVWTRVKMVREDYDDR